MIALLAAILAALPPIPAAWVAALLVGRPEIAPALVRVCHRESRCTAVGIHERDAWLSGSSWGGARQLGRLDPDCQPRSPGWATRGAFGLNVAAHLGYVPRCTPAAAFDVPIVSAIVAAQKYARICEPRRRSGWCP